MSWFHNEYFVHTQMKITSNLAKPLLSLGLHVLCVVGISFAIPYKHECKHKQRKQDNDENREKNPR